MEYPDEYQDLFNEVTIMTENTSENNVIESFTLEDSTIELMEFCKELMESKEEVQTVCFT